MIAAGSAEAPAPVPDAARPARFDRRWIGLAVVVAIYLGFAVAYATAIPIWQSPDEPAHFNYLAEIAETGGLPVLEPGDYDAAYLETLKSRGFPPDLPTDPIRYEGHQPPLYYLAGAAVDRGLGAGSDRERARVARFFSVALGALGIVVAFWIGRLIFPGWLALGPPIFVATLPQRLAIAASVNNDVLAELLMGVFLFALLGVVLPETDDPPAGLGWARRLGRPIPLGLIFGLMLLTKTTLYIGLALVPVAYLLREGRGATGRWRTIAGRVGLVWGIGLAVALWWLIRNAAVYGPADPLAQARHDAIVVGQPATVYAWETVGTAGQTLFRSFWGQFGWMGVPLDDRSYRLLTLLSIGLAVGLGLWAVRAVRRGGPAAGERRWLILLGSALGLLALGVLAYNLKYLQPQGRYLFSALVPIGALFTLGVRGWLPDRLAPAGLALIYPALLALDLWALQHVIRGAFG